MLYAYSLAMDRRGPTTPSAYTLGGSDKYDHDNSFMTTSVASAYTV